MLYLNCVTRTPISNDDEVMICFIAQSKKKMNEGFSPEDNFVIIGAPFEGVYKSRLRCKIKKTEESQFSLEALKKISTNTNIETGDFKKIQELLVKGDFRVNLNGQDFFANIMVFKKSIYDEMLNKLEANNASGKFVKYKKEKTLDRDVSRDLLKKAKKVNPVDQDILIEYSTSVYHNFSSLNRRLNDFDINVSDPIFDKLLEIHYISMLLSDNGYALMPIQEAAEGHNKHDFYKKLKKIEQKKNRENR